MPDFKTAVGRAGCSELPIQFVFAKFISAKNTSLPQARGYRGPRASPTRGPQTIPAKRIVWGEAKRVVWGKSHRGPAPLYLLNLFSAKFTFAENSLTRAESRRETGGVRGIGSPIRFVVCGIHFRKQHLAAAGRGYYRGACPPVLSRASHMMIAAATAALSDSAPDIGIITVLSQSDKSFSLNPADSLPIAKQPFLFSI